MKIKIPSTSLTIAVFFLIFSFKYPVFAENSINKNQTSQNSKENLDTLISSDLLEIDQNKKQFTYSGNVTVRRGTMTLTAKVLDGYYTTDNKLKKLIAKKDVLITNEPNLRASSDEAIFYADSENIELIKNPELAQNGNVMSADKILINIKNNQSQAFGNVRVRLIETK